jgi:predicted alpha/beta hydrolase
MDLVPLAAPDGSTSTARFFPAEPASAALLVLPAMGTHARAYDALATELASRGLATLVAEHRGGESSSVRARRGVDYGYDELLDDLEVQRAALEARVPGRPVHVLGHSLGGHLGVLGVPRWHATGGKLVLIASGTVHFRAWRGRGALSMLASALLADGVSRALGVFPGHRLGFGGLQGRGLMTQWARLARTGEFHGARGFLEAGLDQAQLEVLAISVHDDAWAPRAATERLLAKLARATVRWEELAVPDEPRRLNPHLRWMRSNPAEVARRVAAFLTRPGYGRSSSASEPAP